MIDKPLRAMQNKHRQVLDHISSAIRAAGYEAPHLSMSRSSTDPDVFLVDVTYRSAPGNEKLPRLDAVPVSLESLAFRFPPQPQVRKTKPIAGPR